MTPGEQQVTEYLEGLEREAGQTLQEMRRHILDQVTSRLDGLE